MKNILVPVMLIASCTIAACHNTGNSEATTPDSALAKNDVPVKDNTNNKPAVDTAVLAGPPVDKATSQFVAKAAQGGMMEVELGQLAQQNASAQRVKDFGAMMIRDHSAANDELKGIAQKKNIAIPMAMEGGEKDNQQQLENKHGAAFDQAYIKMMINDHKEDIKEFKKAAGNISDNDVKAFAQKALPVLEKHLDSIMAISKSRPGK